jgi:UDP-glucose 4-epimerase
MLKKKILVIGGSGFMGSHTADELAARGFPVTIFDRTVSPYLQPDQNMVVGDLMDTDSLRKVMEKCDVVYHYAGIADIGEAKSQPYDTIESNVLGLTKALEVAVECGVTRFVYASTMYVYSGYGSFYRASKQAGEIIIEAFHETSGMEYSLLRYGSLYGPRAQSWNGMRRFVTQILQDGKLDYSGTGREVREYIHVHDAAKLSVDILAEEYANRAITITGQQLIRVDELLSILFEIAGKDRSVNYLGTESRCDHYGNTPYRYVPKSAKKIVPQEFVDLGQGLLDLIDEVHRGMDSVED